jgi:flagellar motor component MotA
MTHEEFVKSYNEIVKHIMEFSEKARREGLLASEDKMDQKKINNRDIFEYGMSLVLDGIDVDIIDKILSNIINQEKDEYMCTLKNVQKEAVLLIYAGTNPRIINAVLNSYTGIKLEEDEMHKLLED